MQIEHSEFQDQLVRGLAHRMNNILTLFHGYLGLLLDNKRLDPATKEGLAKIKDGAKAAADLIDRTHSLVRPTTLVWREVNLAEFLRLLKPSFDNMCGEDNVVEYDLQEDLPPIWADATRVKTAIVEVVRNAIDATFGGGKVVIKLRSAPMPPGTKAEKRTHWVCLSVIDTGPGIPEQIGEKIYQPFFSTKKKQHATGLGLTVALNFIQQLDGILRFTSTPGKTEFQFLLPSRE